MGKICYHKTSGVVLAWVRHGLLPAYDSATHAEMDSDSPPPDGMCWDGSAWVSLRPQPDVRGFLGALKAAFPIPARVIISRKYPWFLEAVKEQAWADVQGYLTDALASNVLTQQQYDAIKAAAAAKNIPVALP